MYWRGHVGIALLVYAPFAGVTRAVTEPELAVLGGALAVAFSTVPDLDHRLPVPHRGPTHTVAFAVIVGVLAALVTRLVTAAVGGIVVPVWTPGFVGAVVSVTLCSHVAGDAITPMGIRPFRPLWGRRFTLDLTPAKDPRANRLFLGAGLIAVAISVGAPL